MTTDDLQAGGLSELFAVYGGLGSGRLLITGPPGSGKSGAAILLLLEALHHRERLAKADRSKVPVPVLFTLQGWEPDCRRLETWLIERLVETYRLFVGRNAAAEAGALLAAGKLAVILDGLDEVGEELRPTVLRALSEQAHFRVVLLTRTQEMVTAATQAHLIGAVPLELEDVDAATAADYLTRTQLDPPPARWRELIDHLQGHSASPLSQALNTPLELTLVRDTYSAVDDVAELLDSNQFRTSQAVEDHLLDRVLPAAYAHHPGTPQPRYSREHADRALRYLARRMNEDHTRDLAWWRLSLWTPATPRIVMTAIMVGLVAGLALGSGGLVLALAYGWVAGLSDRSHRTGPLRCLVNHEGHAAGLVFGLAAGVAIGVVWFVSFGLEGLAGGLAIGLLVAGPAAGLSYALSAGRTAGLERRSHGDRSLWCVIRGEGLAASRAGALVLGLGFGQVGLVYGLTNGLGNLFLGLALGVVYGLAYGLVYGLGYWHGTRHATQPGEVSLPHRISSLRWRSLISRHVAAVGLVYGLPFGLVPTVVLLNVDGFGVGASLLSGLSAMAVIGLAAGIAAALRQEQTRDVTPDDPLTSWRHDRNCGLMLGLVVGLAVTTLVAVAVVANALPGDDEIPAELEWAKLRPSDGLWIGLTLNFAAVIAGWVLLSRTWESTLACIQLSAAQGTPMRMVQFLEEARARDLLRTVGPVYQFRHAHLQDRLAGSTRVDAPTVVEEHQPESLSNPLSNLTQREKLEDVKSGRSGRNGGAALREERDVSRGRRIFLAYHLSSGIARWARRGFYVYLPIFVYVAIALPFDDPTVAGLAEAVSDAIVLVVFAAPLFVIRWLATWTERRARVKRVRDVQASTVQDGRPDVAGPGQVAKSDQPYGNPASSAGAIRERIV